jgi:hypothetical protein
MTNADLIARTPSPDSVVTALRAACGHSGPPDGWTGTYTEWLEEERSQIRMMAARALTALSPDREPVGKDEVEVGIILSPEDAALLKMTDLQLAAKCLRNGGAEKLAKVCEAADLRNKAMQEALEFYANPEVYKPHPHGLAFDDRDLSFVARNALSTGER